MAIYIIVIMTTIAVSDGTKKRLVAKGKKGETFEDIIVKLLDSFDDRKGLEGYDAPESGDKKIRR